MSAVIYVCRGCGAEVEIGRNGTSTSNIEWKTHSSRGEDGGGIRIIAVIHMRRLDRPTDGPCGLADPKLGTPDELAISSMTLDEVMGHAAAALRRVMEPDKAERLIATLHRAMLWGQSVDHETQERVDALRTALKKALIPLGPVEPLDEDPKHEPPRGGYSSRSREQVNRARQRIMDAIQRDDRWIELNGRKPNA